MSLLETPHPLSDLATQWVPDSTTALVSPGYLIRQLPWCVWLLVGDGLHCCTGAEPCPWLTPWKEETMWRTREMRWLTGGRKPDEGDLNCIYEAERHPAPAVG